MALFTGSALFAFLVAALPSLVWLVLRVLGIGIVTYVGLEVVFDELENYVLNQWDGLPSDMIQIFAIAGIDVAVKMMIAAYPVGWAIKMTIDGVTRMRFS